jgi:hypothetical protein
MRRRARPRAPPAARAARCQPRRRRRASRPRRQRPRRRAGAGPARAAGSRGALAQALRGLQDLASRRGGIGFDLVGARRDALRHLRQALRRRGRCRRQRIRALRRLAASARQRRTGLGPCRRHRGDARAEIGLARGQPVERRIRLVRSGADRARRRGARLLGACPGRRGAGGERVHLRAQPRSGGAELRHSASGARGESVQFAAQRGAGARGLGLGVLQRGGEAARACLGGLARTAHALEPVGRLAQTLRGVAFALSDQGADALHQRLEPVALRAQRRLGLRAAARERRPRFSKRLGVAAQAHRRVLAVAAEANELRAARLDRAAGGLDHRVRARAELRRERVDPGQPGGGLVRELALLDAQRLARGAHAHGGAIGDRVELRSLVAERRADAARTLRERGERAADRVGARPQRLRRRVGPRADPRQFGLAGLQQPRDRREPLLGLAGGIAERRDMAREGGGRLGAAVPQHVVGADQMSGAPREVARGDVRALGQLVDRGAELCRLAP